MALDSDITAYESFLNDVLKEDLRLLERVHNQLNTDLSEFYELKSSLTHCVELVDKQGDKHRTCDEPIFKSLMDVGGNFMMETEVHDASKVLIHIGLEYYLEFPLRDAIKYVDTRITLLTNQIASIDKQIIAAKGKIKMCVIGLGQMQNLI